MAARLDWPELSRRATLPFLALVALAWAFAWHLGSQRPEPDLYPFLKRCWPGADFRPLAGGRFEVRRQGETLGFAAAGSAGGYGGPITLAVATDPEGRIARVALLEYRDTPDLMRSSRRLLESLLGKRWGEPFRVGADVDGITGATFSSRGIVEAAGAAVSAIGERSARAGARPVDFGAAEATLVLLFALAGYGRHNRRLPARRRSLLRGATLLLSLATLGFLFDRPWVIAFPLRLLAGDWPPWQTHLYGYLLLCGLLFVFDRSGRGPWCPWICPFGAAQDLAGRLTGARRRRMPAGLTFTWVKRLLVAVAVALGLAYRAPGAASYEVFGALFRGNGTGFQISILVLVLLVALFVGRPFCHWLCPVDPLERGLAAVRRRLLGHAAPPRPRGRVLLPVVAASEPPPRDPLRRARNALVTAIGLVCLALVVAHLGDRFARQSRGAQAGCWRRPWSAPDASPDFSPAFVASRRRCPWLQGVATEARGGGPYGPSSTPTERNAADMGRCGGAAEGW